MCEYQTSSTGSLEYFAIRSRYERTQAIAASRCPAAEKPFDRAACTTLAARRLTSHSHGPGSVSSKSLMSKITRRSGVAKPPKFIRWQSPHTCVRMPVFGVPARSAAMFSAVPR